MKTAEPPKRKRVSALSVDAGDGLLRTIKRKMLREKGKIDAADLRQQRAFSDALIERLKSLRRIHSFRLRPINSLRLRPSRPA